MDINVVVASRPNRPPEQDLLKPVIADRLGYGVRLRATRSAYRSPDRRKASHTGGN
jgi:hypothetical protein